MSDILYRFARDKAARLVDVTTVTRDVLETHGHWECPSCGTPMVARLGDKRTHHFAHKNDTASCSFESVWHQSAKLAFLQTFRICVATGRPFLLSWQDHAVCTHYERQGFRCSVQRRMQMDLTREFQDAIIEGGIDSFRADVLLTSATNGKPMLIEFAVTHDCTSEKLASGHRILEIELRGDEDVARLAIPEIDASRTGIRRHNFRPELNTGDYCDGQCDHKVYVLRVYRNQDARIEALTAKEAYNIPEQRVRHQEVLGDTGHIEDYEQAFKQKLVRYWGKGNPVRSCYLCVFHGSCGTRYQVFCRLRKQDFECTEAISCHKFRPFMSMEEFVLQDRRNQSFKRTPWGAPTPPRPKR